MSEYTLCSWFSGRTKLAHKILFPTPHKSWRQQSALLHQHVQTQSHKRWPPACTQCGQPLHWLLGGPLGGRGCRAVPAEDAHGQGLTVWKQEGPWATRGTLGHCFPRQVARFRQASGLRPFSCFSAVPGPGYCKAEGAGLSVSKEGPARVRFLQTC